MITDEQVEAAAKALHDAEYSADDYPFEKEPPYLQNEYRHLDRVALAAAEAVAPNSIERLKDHIDTRLNNCLCEMKEGYDDSIVGFNEAWDIVRAVFAAALRPPPPLP